jgi:hypothetical protein
VTHDLAEWKDEIAWMSLYFSLAVWSSLALGGFGLVRHRLPQYRLRPASAGMVSRRRGSPVAREPRPTPAPRTH